MNRFARALGAVLLWLPVVAPAQTTLGYGAVLTIPIVAETATFTTEIYVQAKGPGSFQFYSVVFIGADGSASPGSSICTAQGLSTGSTVTSLYALCPTLNPGANFGSLTFYPTGLSTAPSVAAYARVRSKAAGNGFSVEGFPQGAIANGKSDSYVQGLERTSSPPGYQSNCFVNSLDAPVTVNLQLEGQSGNVIGNKLTFALAANQVVRVLDVFAAAGLAAGDYTRVRARFWAEPTDPVPSFLGYCTVQNNTSFNADFRIAKVAPGNDDQTKLAAPAVAFAAGVTKDLGNHALPTPVRSAANGIEHRWAIYFQHPGYATCKLTDVAPSGEGNLRLTEPGGTVLPNYGCLDSVQTSMSPKTAFGGGISGRWIVSVTSCTPDVSLTAYTLTCFTGNGATTFTYGGYMSPTTF